MAIGSAPEIGVTFYRWGDTPEEERYKWYRYMQEVYGPDLMGGYGKVIYIERPSQSGTTSDGMEIIEMVEEPFS